MTIKYKCFESFMEQDNVIGDEYVYVDLNLGTIEDQKFLANYYETSLGHIELVDPIKHKYLITTEEREDIEVILYSKDNANKIKDNAYKYFINGLEYPLKNINYPIIESVGKIDLFRYLDREILESNFKLKFKLELFITEKKECKFIELKDNYYIFEI